MEKYVVGVDLGGTKISAALSNLNGEIISQTTVPTNANEGEIPVFVYLTPRILLSNQVNREQQIFLNDNLTYL